MSASTKPVESDSLTEPRLTEEEQRQRQIEINQPAIALLKSWEDDDSWDLEEEMRSLIELMRGIDENRKGYRQLFQDLL